MDNFEVTGCRIDESNTQSFNAIIVMNETKRNPILLSLIVPSLPVDIHQLCYSNDMDPRTFAICKKTNLWSVC